MGIVRFKDSLFCPQFCALGYTLATVLCAGGPSSFGLDWTAEVYLGYPGDLPDSDNLSFGVIPLTYYVCKVVLFR